MKNRINNENFAIETEFFYNSLKLIFNISRLLGTLPLTLTFSSDYLKRNYFAAGDICYTLLYIMFYAMLSIYCLAHRFESDDETNISKIIVLAELSISLSFIFVSIVNGYVVRKLLVRFVKMVRNIDTMAVRKGICLISDKKSVARCIGILLVLVFCTTLIRSSIIFVAMPSGDILQQTTILLASFMRSFSKYYFAAVVLNIKQRFFSINNQIISNFPSKFLHEFDENLRDLCRLHFKLCSVSRSANILFGSQTLFSVAVSVIDVMFHVYYAYVIATKDFDYRVNGWTMAFHMVWMAIELLEIYLMIFVCTQTSDLVRLLKKICIPSSTAVVCRQIVRRLFYLGLEMMLQNRRRKWRER